MLPQSSLPPSLGKGVRKLKLPDMPVGVASYGATIHNDKVYIRAKHRDESAGKLVRPTLVYSTNELKWNSYPEQQGGAATWFEEEGRWKQVLPFMPTGWFRPAVISHDNLLLVTGELAEDGSTVLNTTDVLDLNTMKWTTPEGLNLPVPLWAHHLTLCGGYLYLVGGVTVHPWQSLEDDNTLAWRAKWSDVKQTAASQPQRGVWTQIADPPTLSATPVSCGGTLYTVGGVTTDNKPISTVYTYITARNQWVSVGDMSVGRYFHCAVPHSTNTIFVAGGRVVHEDELTFSPLTELLLL